MIPPPGYYASIRRRIVTVSPSWDGRTIKSPECYSAKKRARDIEKASHPSTANADIWQVTTAILRRLPCR